MKNRIHFRPQVRAVSTQWDTILLRKYSLVHTISSLIQAYRVSTKRSDLPVDSDSIPAFFSGSRIDPKGENYSGRHNGWLLAEFLLERQTSVVAEIACQHKMRRTCWHPFPQCSINRGSSAKPTNHSVQRQTRRWLLRVSLPTVYLVRKWPQKSLILQS